MDLPSLAVVLRAALSSNPYERKAAEQSLNQKLYPKLFGKMLFPEAPENIIFLTTECIPSSLVPQRRQVKASSGQRIYGLPPPFWFQNWRLSSEKTLNPSLSLTHSPSAWIALLGFRSSSLIFSARLSRLFRFSAQRAFPPLYRWNLFNLSRLMGFEKLLPSRSISQAAPALFQYTPQHLVRLLQIIVDGNCDMAVRQVASIHFKNFIA